MKKYILLIFLVATSAIGYAQISTGGQPYSWNKQGLSTEKTPTVSMPKLDMQAIANEDEQNEIGSTRFGFTHNVNLTLSNSGTWQITADGGRLWTLRIASPDALSLNLTYDKFWLPEGGQFYIYSADKSVSIGAFTSLNNKGTKDDPNSFATALIQDKEIVLEYYEPKGVNGGIISIDKVISGYRDLASATVKSRAALDAGDDEWEKEKRALTIIVSENFVTIGTLLNNTNNDNQPYVLVNSLKYEQIKNNSLFYWGTNGVNITNAKVTTGCEILGVSDPDLSENSPFATSHGVIIVTFLKLIESPSDFTNFNPHFLGWDSRNIIPQVGGVDLALQLESWDIQEYTDIEESQGVSFVPVKNFWLADWYTPRTRTYYILGAPLLNSEQRLSGIHSGQYTYHSGRSQNLKSNVKSWVFTENNSIYLKFNIIWNLDLVDANQTNIKRKISHWLSPNSSTPRTLDGMEALSKDILIKNETITASKNFTGRSITAEGSTTISNNATVLMTAEENIVLKPNFKALEGTTVIIKVTGSTNTRSLSTRATTSLEEEAPIEKVEAQLYPNPTTGTIYITEVEDQTISKVEVLNMAGKLVDVIKDVTTSFDISAQPDGMYIIRVHSNDGVATHRIILRK